MFSLLETWTRLRVSSMCGNSIQKDTVSLAKAFSVIFMEIYTKWVRGDDNEN